MLKQGILYNYSKLRFPSMEHLLLLGICAVAVFGWSDSMNSRLILAKQYYTLSALSSAALIFAIKFFRTGILKIDFSTVAWIFTIICTAEAVYAIGQWVGLANSDVIYKVAGHFDNPAGLASCLCVGMPFVIYLYDKGNSKAFLLCGITLLCAVILAKSRTGIIAVVILLTNYTLGKTGIIAIVKDTIKMTKLSKRRWSIVIFIGAAYSLWLSVQKIEMQYKWKNAYKNHDITAYQYIESYLDEDIFFLYNYAVELLDKGLTDKSLNVALKCDKLLANYDLELLLGDIYAIKGDIEQAELHYYRAASMCPCRYMPYNQLYDLYIANGYNEKGLSIARKVIDKPIKVRSRPVMQIRFKMKKALGLTEDA